AASKSAMTPSFIGLIAVMFPGVRPSISFASVPTASMRPFVLLSATIDGSLTTMPRPRAKTQVLAVPRSIARSCEKRESSEENTRDSLMAEPGFDQGHPPRGNVDAAPARGRIDGNARKDTGIRRERTVAPYKTGGRSQNPKEAVTEPGGP